MENQDKFVINVVPTVKLLKRHALDNVVEDTVACRVCNKGFASDMALRNHVRMEHYDIFEQGDPEMWTQQPLTKKQIKKEEKEMIKTKTEKLISSMEPTSIMSLASSDVSYIIIKSEHEPGRVIPGDGEHSYIIVDNGGKKRRERLVEKKQREVQPITGPFECVQTDGAGETCRRVFLSCCEYSEHARDEHTRRRRALRCQVCEKPLGAQTHTHPCLVCGLGFDTQKDLSHHTSTAHVKLKPFQCSICSKRFTQQGGLLQHMRLHTGDRPYTCTFCPKAFTQKSGLDQHLRIHTKVKPYRCVICSKSFCQSIHLKQHMRTHTNVSPFQCIICQKRFKQSSHLNYHLKYHNPANMTDDQKQKYAELVGLISSKDDYEGTEQHIAEQSIIEDGVQQEYILGDSDSWHVKLVEYAGEVDGEEVQYEMTEETVPVEE